MTAAATTTTVVDTVVGAVLFTDLVGFTDFNEVRGDAEALVVLERQRAIVDRMLSVAPGSRVVKELGDGLMIWFASAGAGVSVACDLMRAIDTARGVDDFPLAVRMGLHHGDALVRGDDLVGSTVNVAARVCDLAGPGELLVSDDAIAAGAEQVSETTLECFRPIGPARVKGVGHPVWLHRLTEPDRRSRVLK
ncbi:MAG: adenylate/guanylate cyclase domain-containing protein [Acidimicrobiia bacterium]|nr:adenylate/guanylate cyclase domain-containing protein [Acidimicrobiia bacterium]